MRIAWPAVLLGLVASGCAAHSPNRAPSVGAAEVAARRFATDLYPGTPVRSVTCEPVNDDRVRECIVLYGGECETFDVRYDSQRRVRVAPAVGKTCFVGTGPSGVIPAG